MNRKRVRSGEGSAAPHMLEGNLKLQLFKLLFCFSFPPDKFSQPDGRTCAPWLEQKLIWLWWCTPEEAKWRRADCVICVPSFLLLAKKEICRSIWTKDEMLNPKFACKLICWLESHVAACEPQEETWKNDASFLFGSKFGVKSELSQQAKCGGRGTEEPRH